MGINVGHKIPLAVTAHHTMHFCEGNGATINVLGFSVSFIWIFSILNLPYEPHLENQHEEKLQNFY
jgi:hypothetical protein